MKALVCEMCSSHDIVKQDGMYVCQSCGTKYTPEDAKSLMKEVEGKVDVSGSTVKVDQSDELSKLLSVARRAKEENNAQKAANYYDRVLQIDPDSWEANFYVVYYNSMQTNIAGIANATVRTANALPSTIKLLAKESPAAQALGAMDLANSCIHMASVMVGSAVSHYNGISSDIRAKYTGELNERIAASRDMLYQLGNLIDTNLGEDTACKNAAASAWKAGNECLSKLTNASDFSAKELRYKYTKKIRPYDEAYYQKEREPFLKAVKTYRAGAEKSLTSLENGKESYNPKKLPGFLISLAITIVVAYFTITAVTDDWFRHNHLLLTILLIFVAFVALAVTIFMLANVFPNKKTRENIEKEIAEKTARIEYLKALEKELEES